MILQPNPRDWIYDLETYPNVITSSFKHPATATRQRFEISNRVNQLEELVKFLQLLANAQCRMVGFNNIGFDYPIIHYILDNHCFNLTKEDIYNKAQSIIDTPWNDRWSNVIWDSDTYIQQIDLYKIHHFDNQARTTSLKMLEFNMRSHNIEDLPFEAGKPLETHEIPILLEYNDHDVDETCKFYLKSLEMIEFREYLGKTHDKNFLNHSDKKIGTDLFIQELEKDCPGSCYTYVNGRKQKRQTVRASIPLNDVIFPYITFDHLPFNQVSDWLKSQCITQTKGVFEFLEMQPEMVVNMDPNLVKVHGLVPQDVPHIKHTKTLDNQLKNGLLLSKCQKVLTDHPDLSKLRFVSGWKNQSGLNCVVNGFEYDFGTGGIHGSLKSKIIETDDHGVIFDWDVEGYYPSLGAANKLFPEHLSEQFCITDAMLKQERRKYEKGTPLNNAIKLARNGAYGDSNNKYSVFYDPQYTMSITINGQLLLCMLADKLIKIPGLKMIQINTDGMTVKCPRDYIDYMESICKWWENFTCLTLEHVIYSRMFIRDVNNYIAEYDDGELKRKGAYEHDPKILDWHQNHSELIIPKAAEAFLIRGENIENFIRNHQDIYDFMLRTKVGRSEKLIIKDTKGNERQLQNITRYYASLEGGYMTQISPPPKKYKVGQWKRKPGVSDSYYKEVLDELKSTSGDIDTTNHPWDARINTAKKTTYQMTHRSIVEGQLLSPCNNIDNADFDNIDYDYYIKKAIDLVKLTKVI